MFFALIYFLNSTEAQDPVVFGLHIYTYGAAFLVFAVLTIGFGCCKAEGCLVASAVFAMMLVSLLLYQQQFINLVRIMNIISDCK